MSEPTYVVCLECGARWENFSYSTPRKCKNPECEAGWLDLPQFARKVDADACAERVTA